jgi:hypothetical protein
MAGASLVASAAGGAANTVGSYYAASGQKNALKLQARMDEINASISDRQARDALLKGEKTEQAFRRDAANLRSEQRVGMAANGVDLGSETAAAVLTSTDVLTEQDATQIKANALREAWGLRTEASNYRNDANSKRSTAGAINPLLQAGTTFLTDASKWGGDYAKAKDSGALDTSRKRWSNVGEKAKAWMGG